MEKERLKYCIDRFDHYYDSINNKSAVFLGLGTFIVGGLVAGYPLLKEHVNLNSWLLIFLVLAIVFGFIGLLIVVIAATPYYSKPNSSKFYFNSIASLDMNTFCEESKEYSPDDELPDLRIQVHCLATGLKKKYHRLRIAGIFYTLMLFTTIPLFIMIITNLK